MRRGAHKRRQHQASNTNRINRGPRLGRFPPPWSVEDIGAAFVLKDSAGQSWRMVNFEDEPCRIISNFETRELRTNSLVNGTGNFYEVTGKAFAGYRELPVRFVN
jgi:hypothetical protein